MRLTHPAPERRPDDLRADLAIAEWELARLVAAVQRNSETHHNPESHELRRIVDGLIADAERKERPAGTLRPC